jgi:hypothetical protein
MLSSSRRLRAFALATAFATGLALVLGLAAAPLVASPRASGQALERALVEVLARHGFFVRRSGVGAPWGPDRLAWRDVAYTTLYGGRGHVDFVLRASAFDRPVWVEAMQQRTRGSLDERLPYLLLSAAIAFPDVRVVLVLDGDGWRDGALSWARARAAAIRAKPVEVMTLAGFRAWLRGRLGVE